MIRRLAIAPLVLLATLAISTGAFAQERSFGGDTVQLNLSTGNYRVTSSSDDKIRVIPRTDTDKVSVRLSTNVMGTEATVKVTGPKEGFAADIELPENVRVVAELDGGSLQLSGIRGSKDIAAKSGQIEISVGGKDDYRQVRASVGTGELTAAAFDEKAHGVRTFEWSGKGSYNLNVRVNNGKVTLRN